MLQFRQLKHRHKAMSLTLSFDTLAYVKQLRAADVPEKQAEAQAQALREALDTAFAEQAKAQEQATAQAVDQLDTKTEKALALTHQEIALLHKDIIIKMGGMFIVAIGIIVTAPRLFK